MLAPATQSKTGVRVPQRLDENLMKPAAERGFSLFVGRAGERLDAVNARDAAEPQKKPQGAGRRVRSERRGVGVTR
jgi:hypothetical protein